MTFSGALGEDFLFWGGRRFVSLSFFTNTEDSVASILEMAEARAEIHGFLAVESQIDSKST